MPFLPWVHSSTTNRSSDLLLFVPVSLFLTSIEVVVSNKEVFDWACYNDSIEPEIGTAMQTLWVRSICEPIHREGVTMEMTNPSTQEKLGLFLFCVVFVCLTLTIKKTMPGKHGLLRVCLTPSMPSDQAQHKALTNQWKKDS